MVKDCIFLMFGYPMSFSRSIQTKNHMVKQFSNQIQQNFQGPSCSQSSTWRCFTASAAPFTAAWCACATRSCGPAQKAEIFQAKALRIQDDPKPSKTNLTFVGFDWICVILMNGRWMYLLGKLDFKELRLRSEQAVSTSPLRARQRLLKVYTMLY